MIFFYILSQIFLFSNQNKIPTNGKLLKEILMEDLSSNNISIYCPKNKSIIFKNRERPTDIRVIRNNNKYKCYSSVYIDEDIDENEINKFPKSTIFYINKENFDFSKINNNNNYCFISYDNNLYKYSFLKSGRNLEDYLNNSIYFLIVFSLANYFIYFIYRYFYNLIIIKLEVNFIARILLISCMFLPFCCIFYYFLPSFSITYSLYKSYLFVILFNLLKGFKILYFPNQASYQKIKTITIILSIIESITTILFLYLGEIKEYNFYFFCGRNLIEYLVLLVITIKMFFNNFINLYRRYRLERRIRTILTLAYKYRLIVYSKVCIFSLLYSLGFIAINIFPIIIFYKKEYYNDTYLDESGFIIYINISLAILFAIIFSIIFFPVHNSLLFYMEANINMYFLTEIKKAKEKKMEINNLTKNIVKQYYKKEYPSIFLEPFAKTNDFLNNCQIHMGITKKK